MATRQIVMRVAPWLIAGGIVAFILSQYSVEQIAREVARGDVWSMLPFAMIGPVGYLFFIAAADRAILLSLERNVTYWDVFRGRAATATLAALSYIFGGGAYGVWIAYRTKTPAKVAAGALLFVLMSDLTAVCALAGAAMVWSPEAAQPVLRAIALGIVVFQVAAIAIGPRFGLEARASATAWARTPRAIAYAQLAARGLAISCSVLAVWAGARAFGLEIPFYWAAIHVPIALLVQSMPINVAGIGAAQGVWLLAFSRYAPGEQILAFQLLWQLAHNSMLVLRGLPFLRRTIGEIRR